MLNHPVDIYCERLDASFWAEPLNAFSNFAFILTAVMAIYLHKKEGLNNFSFIFLAILVFFIGVGSFLFHTFANTFSELADIVPIWSFVVFYVLFSIRIIFRASWGKTAKIMGLVILMSYLGVVLSQTDGSADETVLNGSLQYAPALFFMAVFTFSLYLKRPLLFQYGLLAMIVFLSSLSFRTIDMMFCDSVAIGTHFAWHILNAIMLYLLLFIMHRAIKHDMKLKNRGYKSSS